ncbi:MAG: flavodoxin family protein [Desulfobacteraceae bacterium]|nr:flavodoxin family protein [Desulfobacteraceae bacterium]
MEIPYKIFIINGSHRSENGFTEIVLKKFIKGAESAKAQCEVLYPSKKKIFPCESCGKCLFETPGACKYNDDMDSVILKMEEADLLVFASPVYFDSMSSNLKKIIERLRSTLDAYFEFRNGRTYHLKINKKKKNAITIFTAGNPERESFFSISRIFNRIIDNMGWQLAGEFQFPASHLLVAEPEILASQLEAVAISGKEIVLKGEISKKLLEKANSEYIDDPKTTLHHMTQMILEMRKDNQAISTGTKKMRI